MSLKNNKFSTQVTHSGRHPQAHHGAVNPPVYHASTILSPSVQERRRLTSTTGDKNVSKTFSSARQGMPTSSYGRKGTPTSAAFEEAVAEIYGADDAVAVSSGLAAIACALQTILKSGDHILVTDTIYLPTRRFCDVYLAKMGVTTTYYNPYRGADIAALITEQTAAVFVESPGSLTFEIMDIPAIAAVAHAHDIPVVMDNTWASAMFFKPFEKGVDIVIEAVTKYICGHSDVMMGVIVANAPHIQRIREMCHMQGQCCGPDDLYLAQRGLRTMVVRMKQNEANALALAHWLETRKEVAEVRHPGLPSHPDHALWQRDFSGSSGLFAIIMQDYPEAAIEAFVDGLRFYGIGASWGGYESLILPGHPSSTRTATRWQARGQLLRIHAGLEDVEDLKSDLARGFDRLNALVG